MGEKINLDLKAIQFIFAKNKSYIFPIIIMLACVILFFQFIIPQFKSLLKVQEDAKESLLKLKILKENMSMLANIDEETLDSQLRILNLALPSDKDFAGVLNSVYSTAQRTGVEVGGFSFKVGDLSRPANSDSLSVVELSMPINAGVAAVSSFVEVISKTFPLSQVSFIKAGSMSSTVSISFYYKPLAISSYNQDARVKPISQKGLDLVNQLSKFEGVSLNP
jgi:Tfp pilus assembly protein PilO